MSRGGFGRGRPRLNKEAMVGKQVVMPPSLWRKVEDQAQSESDEREVSQAEIVRRAVDAFFKEAPAAVNRIPMLGVIFGGTAQNVQMAPNHTTVDVPFDVGTDAYALLVVGDSMESDDGVSIPNGHYAIFSPDRVTTPGALVHVEWTDETNGDQVCTFKKYVPAASGGAVFRPLNGKHNPIPRRAGDYSIRGIFKQSWDGTHPDAAE